MKPFIISILPATLLLIMTVMPMAAVGLASNFERKFEQTKKCETDTNCINPYCFCESTQHPGNLTLDEVPQMVFITFSEAITVANYPLYQKIFDGTRLNPNRAPISATFFVTHRYNNYSLTHQLYRQGHEIGLNSMTNENGLGYWQNLNETGWSAEYLDQREQVARFAAVPIRKIVGTQATSSFVGGGGDQMYHTFWAGALKYDNSWWHRGTQKLWPFTADHGIGEGDDSCQIAPCPATGKYPQFWIAPNNDLTGSNGTPCAFIDVCLDTPNSATEVYELLIQNFNQNYQGNKAPFGLRTHATWLQSEDYLLEGFLLFLDEILAKDDVYVIGINKAFDWMENPQSVTNINTPGTMPSWDVPVVPIPDDCPVPTNCHYSGSQLPPGFIGDEEILNTCTPCPTNYPWIGGHLGD